MRDGVGIIPISGPTFKRANLFTEVCGATSYEIVLRDLQALIDNPSVKAILLSIDSPGGEANGISELAEHVYAARGRKPIHAYIGGMGASAAYWLASAADKIFAEETAFVGSIGAQVVVRSRNNSGELKFVSSVSPNKNQDPATDAGATEIQRMVDGLGSIFVQKVARNRALSPETVLEKFGQGSLYIGNSALERGMIDSINSFEGTLLSIQETIEKETINPPNFNSDEIAKATAEARRIESDRILGIQAIARGRVSPEFTDNLIAEGLTVEQAALQILSRSDEDRTQRLSELKKADDALMPVSGKPVKAEDDAFESDLRQAASLGLVALS
ncbi:MAG TPA: S49 family peptidase [Oligoflexus sp.]|uniref:S49 family peptidase n=1 Tax=Oligoflexus sp. TaxID=1971216 RepID=UPI002D3F46A1|nr:S49 family peptidase [Oligoflexus sp.]HYX35310.1 S49 family peptidase [Oligoflexus sp.]